MLLALVVLIGGCGDATGPDGGGLPPGMVDSGSWYRTGFRWPHDGKPYESPNFIVYSDAASPEARQKLAEIGEELLVVLKNDFEIDAETMFRFPAGQSKLHIYAYKNHTPMEWGGWGYYGGLLIFSLDHELRTEWGHTELENYTRVVTHELMHAVEGLLKGSDNPHLVDVWLTEGIAEYVAGGTSSGSVTDLARLDELTSTYGEWNPIAMHRYDYPDIEAIGFLYYYPMFELAVTYLLDPAGAGNAKPSIRDIFHDARDGVPFATSIENRLGIGLQEYEDEFFDRIRAFLN
jgi:hypothetical protein